MNTTITYFKVKKSNPYATSWVNEDLVKLCNRKHRLLSKRNAGVFSRNLNERIVEVTRKVSEMKHFLRSRDQISKFGPGVNYKTKWKNLNNLLRRGGRQSEISKIIGNDGEIVTETIDIAESILYKHRVICIDTTGCNL